MAQKTKLYINVPADIGSASWGQQVLKSYLHNAKIIYKRENKKLLNHMKKYGEKIYDLVIAEFYKSYTPAVYDRHGDIKGFNLYRANNFVVPNINDVRGDVEYDWKIFDLLPYHSWWQKKEYEKGKLEPRGVNRKTVFQMVLLGVRALVYKYDSHGRLKRGRATGKPLLRKYTFKVSYSLGVFKHTFNGAPYQIFMDAADYLVQRYNTEIIRSIRKGISNIPMRWVN